jgi:hypothetical protein
VHRSKSSLLILAILLLTLAISVPAIAASPTPGEPPLLLPTPAAHHPAASSAALGHYKTFLPQMQRGLDEQQVSLDNRQAVLDFYNRDYLGYPTPAINWTGSQASCIPGTTSPAFQDAVLHRINFFRAMAGVPSNVTFSADSNRKAQAAALMMSANGLLNHTPPTTWKCYSSDGAAGAGSSDLFLGMYSWNAISGYMLDPGSGNSAAGHRRWILYPQTQVMGTGDIPSSSGYSSANSLVIFDAHYGGARPLTRDDFVAWPPPGYVPSPLVYARWSFSYPNADFSAAQVSMISNGASVSLTQSPVANGYGENTLVWIPLGMLDGATWPRPSADTSYTVTLNNVKVNGIPRSFTYTVTIIAP